MPHNQHVRDALFNAFIDGPVGMTAGQASQLANVAVEAIEQELEDARIFRWISENATFRWSGDHTQAEVCFPLKADMFEEVEEVLRRLMGDPPKGEE